jgi:hypothetical protein
MYSFNSMHGSGFPIMVGLCRAPRAISMRKRVLSLRSVEGIAKRTPQLDGRDLAESVSGARRGVFHTQRHPSLKSSASVR